MYILYTIYMLCVQLYAYLSSLSSKVLEKVTLGWVLSQEAEGLLLSDAAHKTDHVGVWILSNFLGLKYVFEKNLAVFVRSILCKSKEVTLHFVHVYMGTYKFLLFCLFLIPILLLTLLSPLPSNFFPLL